MMPAITTMTDYDAKKNISPDVAQQIHRQLQTWIENKGYTQKGITIQVLSSVAYTNRTYLSQYINKTFGCSFKIWVTRLRIEEAKRILRDKQHNYNTNEVADMVGCSSSTSFAHAFKKYEGVSPSLWRQQVEREQQNRMP